MEDTASFDVLPTALPTRRAYYLAEFATIALWVAVILALVIYGVVREVKNKNDLEDLSRSLNPIWPPGAWECRNPGAVLDPQPHLGFLGTQILRDGDLVTSMFDPALRATCITCRDEEVSAGGTYPLYETYLPRAVNATDGVSAGGLFTRDGRLSFGSLFSTSTSFEATRCIAARFNSYYLVTNVTDGPVHLCYCRQRPTLSTGKEFCSDALLDSGDFGLNCVGGNGGAATDCSLCDTANELC